MTNMKRSGAILLTGLALMCVDALTFPVQAENVTQTIEMVRVDVQKLSTGYRTSKLIGSEVVNNANEVIGKIDDLIVSPDDNKTAYVIISVGGWLGVGIHLVALPYDNFRITNSKVVLSGATKEGLKLLPEFKYKTN